MTEQFLSLPVTKQLLDFVVYRQFDPAEDYNFVLSSWAHSFKGSPWAGVCPNNRWHSLMKETIDQLIERGANIVMAVADDDPSQILGYVCFERSACGVSVVHYIFVKDDFREDYGLGKALLGLTGEGSFIFTFRTPDGRYLEKGGIHVPAIGRRKNLEPVYAINKT